MRGLVDPLTRRHTNTHRGGNAYAKEGFQLGKEKEKGAGERGGVK